MSDDIVLLIHGTGKIPDEEEGQLWWQTGSKFCEIVNDDLFPYARCHEKGEVFRWSGRNSEQDRRAGGKKLYQHLLEFEKRKQTYHLIAHSHGGQVIWHALSLAVKNKYQMKHLKSWCTFGTPFFQYRANTADLWLLLPFIISFMALYTIANEYLWLFIPGVKLSWQQVDKTATLTMVFLCFLLFVVLTSSGFRICLAIKNIFLIYDFHMLGKKVARLYSYCWSDLYSKNDEAINGLIGSISPSDKIIPRWENKYKSITMRLIWAPVIFGYNIMAFFIDEYVWGKIKKGMQGTDIMGFTLDKVCWPYYGKCEVVELPPEINSQMVKWANQNLRDLIEPLRESIGNMEMISMMPKLTKPLVGKEMVHSSYYQLEAVIHLFSEQIKKHLPPPTQDVLASIPKKQSAVSAAYKQVKKNAMYFHLLVFIISFSMATIGWWGAKKYYTSQLQSGILLGGYLNSILLTNVNLNNAKLSKADFTEANLVGSSLQKVDLQEADMWEANLGYTDFKNADLSLAQLDGARFFKAKLIQANLSSASIRETYLVQVNAHKACFNFADLQQANGSQGNFSQAYFWSSNLGEISLISSNLKGAKLFFANLENANLTGANFSGANLTGASLAGANLNGTNFTGANMSRANFTNAILQNTILTDVQGLTLEQILKCKKIKNVKGLPKEFIPLLEVVKDKD